MLLRYQEEFKVNPLVHDIMIFLGLEVNIMRIGLVNCKKRFLSKKEGLTLRKESIQLWQIELKNLDGIDCVNPLDHFAPTLLESFMQMQSNFLKMMKNGKNTLALLGERNLFSQKLI